MEKSVPEAHHKEKVWNSEEKENKIAYLRINLEFAHHQEKIKPRWELLYQPSVSSLQIRSSSWSSQMQTWEYGIPLK